MKVAHSEQTSVGEIRYVYSFRQQEIKALRLLLSEPDQLSTQFCALWSDISHYENASFGVKELMPTIVHKLQKNGQFSDLAICLKNDYLMLQSLPKYTWTKNWYARNQLIQIAKQLKLSEIDFVLLKGIAETFLDAEALNARTCRDIDILVSPLQIAQFTHVVASLGWECKDITPETVADPSSFAGNAFTFRHPTGIVELDVHFSGASLNWSSQEKFVQQIWLEAHTTDSNFLIPSDQCRLLLSAWNVFDIENIKSEQILKYFYDFMRGTKSMSMSSKLAFVKVAAQNLNFAKQVIWLLTLDAHIKRNWLQYVLFQLMFFVATPSKHNFKIRTNEKIYFWLYHTKNIVLTRFDERLTWHQMLFRTVVESDIYKARRNSYTSIMRTKRDNLRSALLSRYRRSQDFLSGKNKLTSLSTSDILKNIVRTGIALPMRCARVIKRILSNFSFRTRRDAPDSALLPDASDRGKAESQVKRLYFVSHNYFGVLPKK